MQPCSGLIAGTGRAAARVIAALSVAACAARAGAHEPAAGGLLCTPVELDRAGLDRMTSAFRRPAQEPGGLDVAASGLQVDTLDRTAVVSFYHCQYRRSADFATRMNWSGDVLNCDAGTVSTNFHADTLRRINYFRAMAGVNADIVLDSVKDAKCQEAAMIMSRNGALSHFPVRDHPDWACLNPEGDEAAGRSNLSLGKTGPGCVDQQMEDFGANNAPVGHRRWLLFPRARVMGTGGVPGTGDLWESGVVWVLGDFAPPPATPRPVSWPNAGFVPYSLVYPRWSFSLAGANFAGATVTMSCEGEAVSLNKIHPTAQSPASGQGDPTIVWEPQGLPSGAATNDRTYVVTIDGVTGTGTSTYTYAVTVIDPWDLGEPVVVTGPGRVLVGATNTYALSAVRQAIEYRVAIWTLADTTWVEGAEDAPAPKVLADISAGYDLRQNSVVRTGAKAFHLAFPDWRAQYLELDRSLVPSTLSALEFAFLRRFSHTVNVLSGDLSLDDGRTWRTVWRTNGVCGGSCNSSQWDSEWRRVSVPLAAFSGSRIRVRFGYVPDVSIFTGSSAADGVFLDDIRVTNAREVTRTVERVLPGSATSFDFVADGLYAYMLDAAATVGCHRFARGPAAVVTAIERGPRMTVVSAHGRPDPPVGTREDAPGAAVMAWAGPVEGRGTTQYVCSGWSLVGQTDTNGLAAGSGTNLALVLNDDCVLTWRWRTNYWLSAEADTNGRVEFSTNWWAAGLTATVRAIPSLHSHFDRWSGSVASTANPLELAMTRAHSVKARFAWNLAMHGTPEWWLASHGWSNDFDRAALADADADGLAAWEEYVAGTSPTNRNSAFSLSGRMTDASPLLFVASWSSVTGKTYRVSAASDLRKEWTNVISVAGTGGVQSFTNRTSPAGGCFLRVSVRQP